MILSQITHVHKDKDLNETCAIYEIIITTFALCSDFVKGHPGKSWDNI
jgi:hypothetical protein